MTKQDLRIAKQGELKLIQYLKNIGFDFNKEKLNNLRGKTNEEIYQFISNNYNNLTEQKRYEIAQNFLEVGINDIVFMIGTQLDFVKTLEKELN